MCYFLLNFNFLLDTFVVVPSTATSLLSIPLVRIKIITCLCCVYIKQQCLSYGGEQCHQGFEQSGSLAIFQTFQIRILFSFQNYLNEEASDSSASSGPTTKKQHNTVSHSSWVKLCPFSLKIMQGDASIFIYEISTAMNITWMFVDLVTKLNKIGFFEDLLLHILYSFQQVCSSTQVKRYVCRFNIFQLILC